jgi:hypothetical protein
MLYRAAAPFFVGLLATAGTFAWIFWIDPLMGETPGGFDEFLQQMDAVIEGRGILFGFNNPQRLWLIPLALTILLYGAVHYRWVAKQLMANYKSADGVTFSSALKGPRITMIYVLGNFIAYMALIVGIGLMVVLGGLMFGYGLFVSPDIGGANPFSDWPRIVSLVLLAVVYLGVFLMWGVLHNTFVTFPIMRHMALTTTLPTTIGITGISQRARDELAQAEGFAEALDLGAAI